MSEHIESTAIERVVDAVKTRRVFPSGGIGALDGQGAASSTPAAR